MRYVIDIFDTPDVVGSSLSGYVTATYEELNAIFSEDNESFCDKTNAQWAVSFYDNEEERYVTATIYDWKEDSVPVGKYKWHIGGYDRGEVDAVMDTIEAYRKETA